MEACLRTVISHMLIVLRLVSNSVGLLSGRGQGGVGFGAGGRTLACLVHARGSIRNPRLTAQVPAVLCLSYCHCAIVESSRPSIVDVDCIIALDYLLQAAPSKVLGSLLTPRPWRDRNR